MHSLAHDWPAPLLAEREAPCLSLDDPSHRQHPDNAQDPVRLRNPVEQVDASLSAKYPSDTKALRRPLEALAGNRDVWNPAGAGLAVLGAPDIFRVYLQRPVAERAVVADSLHAKPLMRIVQSADRHQVLGLNRHAFKVVEGNRDALDELAPIAGVPQTAAELLGRADDAREGAQRIEGADEATGVSWHGTDVKLTAAIYRF